VDAAEARLMTAALPSEALGGLNGARMSAQEATKLLAPLVGAGLFAAVGGPAVAAVAAGAVVISAGLYTLIRPRAAGVAPARRPLWSETVAGVRFLLASPIVRTPVVMASVAMLASGIGTAAIYSIVDQALHRPPAFVGVLSSVQGAGAIVGGLVVGRLLDRFGETAVAAIGAVTFSLGPCAQAMGTLPSVLAGSAMVGIGLPWTVVAALTAVQRHTPYEMVGRVAGAGNTLVFAPPALGIPLGALLVTVVDYRIPLVVAAAGCAAIAAAVLRTADQLRSAPASAGATSAPASAEAQ
jgi:MFS family permease